MSVMFNMILADQKQNLVPQNVSSKMGVNGDQLTKGFAKVLTIETDKSGLNVDSKVKIDDDEQLIMAMAAMVGMGLPVTGNLIPVKQGDVNAVDNLVGVVSTTQIKLPDIMPKVADAASSVLAQTTVADAASSVLEQRTVAEAAPSGLEQRTVAEAVPSGLEQRTVAEAAPSGLEQRTVAESIPSGLEQRTVAEAAPSGLAQRIVADAVSSGLVKVEVTASMDTYQNQLATQTAANSQVDSNRFAQLQAQLHMQNTQYVKQPQSIDPSKKSTDILIANPVLINTHPVSATVVNSNSFEKNTRKPLDGKKIVADQVNTEVIDVTDSVPVVSAATGKTMLAPQAIINDVVDLAGKKIEITSTLSGGTDQLEVDTILTNQTAKDTDSFAGVLNQQAIKIESQLGMAEVKQVSSQPMADPHNIASQIVDQARLVAKPQNTEMIIQLKPEHLGELTFKVTVENGIVSASFHSNNAEVRSIIESSLTQLKQDLSNQGLKIDNVGVYAGLGQFFSNGQQSGNNQQPILKVQNKKKTEEFLDVFSAIDSTDKVLEGAGVDYRV